VLKEDIIVSAKIDFSNIQPEVGWLQKELFKGFEGRYEHPVKRERHNEDEEHQPHYSEDSDHYSFNMFSIHHKS
jgi:hypothetical protein